MIEGQMENWERWEISRELQKQIEAKAIPINTNGHIVHFSHITLKGDVSKNWKECNADIDVSFTSKECCNCGEVIENIKLDSRGVTVGNTKCKYSNGLKYDFYLNVPSGKLVIANDLRALFPMHGDYYINLAFNCMKTSMKYASMGLAHAFVGNTCPSVFKLDNSNFAIGVKGSRNQNPIKDAKRVAGICTDLWWYSICDFDEFQKRNKKNIDFDVSIVKCEPGYYKFTHLYFKNNTEDYKKPVLYTKIKRVSKPKPVVDYEAEYMKLNITAGQAVKQQFESWNCIFPTYQKAAESILFRHRMFHPNGWVFDYPDVSNDMPDMEIPMFNAPITEYDARNQSCALAYMAGVGKGAYDFRGYKNFPKLNDSYIQLVFNILQALVRHGLYLQESPLDLKKETTFPEWAKEALISMANKYPTLVPNYCKPLLTGECQS